MNVLLAAVGYSDSISGVQRHGFNLARALLLRSEVKRVDMLVAPWQLACALAAGPSEHPRFALHTIDVHRSAIGRNAWYLFSLPRIVRRLKPDVVHLTYPVPVNAAALHVPLITTLHDLYPYELPDNFGPARAAVQRLILRQCLGEANAIACVSQSTAEILDCVLPGLRLAKEVIRVYNAVEPYRGTLLEPPLPSVGADPFLLCVAQHRKNKNIDLLLRAMSRMLLDDQLPRRTQLLIVGIPGPESLNIRTSAVHLGLTARLHLLNGLSEARLQWCYRNALALVLPSTSEGFGLPVAEALLAGCRVICSDIPTLHEIGTSHCNYFSLREDAEANLIGAIRRALVTPPQAPVDLPQFSLQIIGEQYLDLYQRLLAPSPVPVPLLTRSPHPERHLL